MASSALIKTILHKSLAEGVYKDVITRSSLYYYYLGKTLGWDDEANPPYPIDSLEYERMSRNEIITVKEIRPSDVAFVVPRIDWVSGTVYDMYDDMLCEEVIGINIISGGSGYIDIYDSTITITGGGGTGATAQVSEVANGQIAQIELLTRGTGYITDPVVTITSASGTGAVLEAVIGKSATGSQKIEEAPFYVVTDDFNVYKCLDNNNGAFSTYKPVGTDLTPFRNSVDGYVWKFMYNIPLNLRNKFFTESHMPVVSALTNQFYSNGTIDNIFIANKGKNYTSASVTVNGDGYREADPIYLNSIRVENGGTGYVNPTVVFGDPHTNASGFVPSATVTLGQKIYNSTGDFYEVATPGVFGSNEPTHRFQTVLNGTAALKYIGSRVKGELVVTNPKNITEITLTDGGSGYKTAPSVTITDSTGTGATATASIGTSSISSIQIVNGGSGYTSSPIISFNGGGGAGVQVVPTVTGGVITAVQIITNGAGYTTAPSITIEDATGVGAQLTAVLSGSPIISITVTGGGGNYTAPTVTITGGGGVGGTAEAKVETGIIDDIILSGSVRDVLIINPGSGYITAPDVNIIGGGGEYAVVKSKLFADKVISTYVVNSGDGFTSTPEVTFGTPWQQGLEVYTNSQFYNGNNLYTVIASGVFGSSSPTHISGVAVSSDVWTANNPYSDVITGTIGVTNGSNVVSGSGSDFQTDIDVGQTIIINNVEYTVSDIVNEEDLRLTSVYNGDTEEGITATKKNTLYYGDRLYAVVGSGLTGSTAPVHTSGSATNGDLTLHYLGVPATLRKDGQVATGSVVLRYGAGYSVTPSITFVDEAGDGAEASFSTAKSEARIVPIVDNGQVVSLVIEDPGVGYTKAVLSVEGEGTGAALVADLSLGSISSQQANNEILTPAGTIDAIAVVSKGYSYGVANISIKGDGTGAEAVAVIDPITNGITKVLITNRGQDYTYADVYVTGNGYGAKLRAIIAPYGGHGKNSPEELYARSLMFYSNVSTDLNQGISVANDYRQVGIIKNPKVYGGYENYQGTIGSCCYIIQVQENTFNPEQFGRDTNCYIERIIRPDLQWGPTLQLTIGDFFYYEDRIYTCIVSGLTSSLPPTTTSGSELNGTAVVTYVGSTKNKKRYRVVSYTTSSVLVQSLDNDEPRIADVFISALNITHNFAAINVGAPSVDKYSGQLMYIDNKEGFTPSADETITLRTIIQF